MDHEPTTDELDTEREPGARASVADPPLIAAGRRLGGRYVLERRLGHGGMAVVWLATDERLGRPVAVKILSDTLTADAEYLGRFRREARVAAGLQHPNLVSVYDFDAGERPYLVMEYIEGGDLAARLERGDTPSADGLARELLAALRHIHGAGVLHRDIKPQNVLIDHHGHARLTDFGIAQPRNATSLTRTGQVIGTEAFIAPELMAGEPASERSDLYALGVLLADLAREGAAAPLWSLTDRLREREPDQRPASAAEALAELQRSAASPPGDATQPFDVPAEPLPPPPTDPRGPFEPTVSTSQTAAGRRRARIAVVLTAVVLAATAAIIVLGGGDDGTGGGQGSRAASEGRSKGGDGGSDAGGGSQSGDGGGAAAVAEPPADEPAATVEPATGDGVDLNNQGFALLGAGRYEEAIPILEQAVDALRGSGDEQTYNYALYNLGSAYVGAGRFDEAIPLLEERLNYPNQTGTVQAKLDEALAGAGEATEGKPPKEPKEPKSGKPIPPGHSGGVPPGHADD